MPIFEVIAYGKREELKLSPEGKVMGLSKGESEREEKRTSKCC